MALFDTQLAMLANQASNALISGKDPPRQGNTHPNIVPYQPFEAADQPIIIAVGNDRQFARLAEMCGHPEWTRDDRFASNEARVANRDEIVRLVSDSIATKPAAEWLERLEAAGIPAGPINRISRRCPTSRPSIVKSSGRLPAYRSSAHRYELTARERTRTCLRRPLANIRTMSWRTSAFRPKKRNGSGPKV